MVRQRLKRMKSMAMAAASSKIRLGSTFLRFQSSHCVSDVRVPVASEWDRTDVGITSQCDPLSSHLDRPKSHEHIRSPLKIVSESPTQERLCKSIWFLGFPVAPAQALTEYRSFSFLLLVNVKVSLAWALLFRECSVGGCPAYQQGEGEPSW